MKCIAYANSGKKGSIAFETEEPDWPYKWEKPIVTYSLQQGTVDIEGDTIETAALSLAMLSWELEINLKLKRVKASENPDIHVKFLTSEQDELFTKEKSVLAYAYYPKTSLAGTVVFNEDYLWSWDGKPIPAWKVDPEHYQPGTKTTFKTYNLQQTLLHELGHSLGFKHLVNCENCVMYPYYNNQTTLQEADIARAVAKYGKSTKSQAIINRLKIWLIERKKRDIY